MNEQITQLLQKKWVIPTGVGVLSFVAGTGVGYLIADGRWRKVAKEAVDIVNDMADDVEEFVDDILPPDAIIIEEVPQPDPVDISKYRDRPNPADITVDEELQSELEGKIADGMPPSQAYAELFEKIEQGNYVEESPEPEIVNVFENPDSEWDYDLETESRTETAPFILHRDEYWANELDFDQVTLTYYVGDDILVDSGDSPIYNYAMVVGELRFGHGSGDKNVLYVRNHELKSEYEILRDSGSYSVEVLGLDDTPEEVIRHSSPRKFRLNE